MRGNDYLGDQDMRKNNLKDGEHFTCGACKRSVLILPLRTGHILMFNVEDHKVHYCSNSSVYEGWNEAFKSTVEFEEWLKTETFERARSQLLLDERGPKKPVCLIRSSGIPQKLRTLLAQALRGVDRYGQKVYIITGW